MKQSRKPRKAEKIENGKKKNKQKTRTQAADLITLSTDCPNTPIISREW